MQKLFIIFLLFPLTAFGQQKSIKNSQLAFDLIFSPDSYAATKLPSSAVFYQISAYRLGFNTVWDLEDYPHLAFRAGLRYASYKQRISGIIFVNLPNFKGTLSGERNINYFDLPLFLRYSVGKKKMRWYGELGGGIEYVPKISEKEFQTYWGFSLGFEYQFHLPFSCFIQPIYRRAVKVNNTSFFSTGLELGVKYILPEY